MRVRTASLVVATALLLASCATTSEPDDTSEPAGTSPGPSSPTGDSADADADTDADRAGAPTGLADVTAVEVSGEAGAYTFAVTISSPDTGCEQYADFWEVVTVDGELLTRRVLAHSHVDEQPFTRSGGPVAVEPDETVVVRAHMSPGGYGGTALQGSVTGGFAVADVGPDFAAELAGEPPEVGDCAF